MPPDFGGACADAVVALAARNATDKRAAARTDTGRLGMVLFGLLDVAVLMILSNLSFDVIRPSSWRIDRVRMRRRAIGISGYIE